MTNYLRDRVKKPAFIDDTVCQILSQYFNSYPQIFNLSKFQNGSQSSYNNICPQINFKFGLTTIKQIRNVLYYKS